MTTSTINTGHSRRQRPFPPHKSLPLDDSLAQEAFRIYGVASAVNAGRTGAAYFMHARRYAACHRNISRFPPSSAATAVRIRCNRAYISASPLRLGDHGLVDDPHGVHIPMRVVRGGVRGERARRVWWLGETDARHGTD